MMDTFRKIIFSNWNFMRWFRLAIGIIVAFQSYELQNGLMGLLAGLFIFQALANTGCCGSTGCSVETNRKNTHKPVNTDLENVKTIMSIPLTKRDEYAHDSFIATKK